MWIEPEISEWLQSRKALGILAIVGVRQAGKSALLRRADPTRRWLSLDDIGLRELANQDPDLLLRAPRRRGPSKGPPQAAPTAPPTSRSRTRAPARSLASATVARYPAPLIGHRRTPEPGVG